MSTFSLLPNKYKMIGWCILIPAFIFGIVLMCTNFESLPLHAKVFAFSDEEPFSSNKPFSFVHTNITATITGMLFLVGAMLVSFSKEKREDEFIASLRLSSLLWAVLVNYIFLLFAFAFIYGMVFFNVMIYNMFTVFIIFILRFNYVLYRSNKSSSYEK